MQRITELDRRIIRIARQYTKSEADAVILSGRLKRAYMDAGWIKPEEMKNGK